MAKLQKLGIEPELEEIITASYITCLYIQEHFPVAKVLVIGESALEEELEAFNILRSENPILVIYPF